MMHETRDLAPNELSVVCQTFFYRQDKTNLFRTTNQFTYAFCGNWLCFGIRCVRPPVVEVKPNIKVIKKRKLFN